MSKRDEYVSKMKLELDSLNEKIDKLEASAHEAKEAARAKYHEELAKLRKQSKAAVDKLAQIKTASEDGWQIMVLEMENARDALVHAFHYFKSQL